MHIRSRFNYKQTINSYHGITKIWIETFRTTVADLVILSEARSTRPGSSNHNTIMQTTILSDPMSQDGVNTHLSIVLLVDEVAAGGAADVVLGVVSTVGAVGVVVGASRVGFAVSTETAPTVSYALIELSMEVCTTSLYKLIDEPISTEKAAGSGVSSVDTGAPEGPPEACRVVAFPLITVE